MDYKRIYDSLIDRARDRLLETYSEKHHIIPRCMGGSDDDNNLVPLTPEEHYLAHQLLIKIYPGNHKLAKAAVMMTAQRSNNKIYGWLRVRHAEAQKICQSGEGNSQHGTRWIHNTDLCESKKILKSEPLPEGWNEGRVIDFNKVNEVKRLKLERQLLKEENQKKEVDKYREYYILYKQVGWKEFVKQTGYDKSKPNLVTRFNRLLPEFVPQNGKRRGKN
jgi:hypothetical protein